MRLYTHEKWKIHTIVTQLQVHHNTVENALRRATGRGGLGRRAAGGVRLGGLKGGRAPSPRAAKP